MQARRRHRGAVTIGTLCTSACLVVAALVTADDYRRAERMLPEFGTSLVDGLQVSPRWIDGGTAFWYETRRDGKPAFFRVEAASGAQRELPEADARALAGEDEASPGVALSPDGRWAVSTVGHDLQVRRRDDGQLRRLTHDGRPGRAYGSHAGLKVPPAADDAPPAVYFSPDSNRILTYRLNVTDVPALHLVQTRGGERPQLRSFPYPMPGDPVAEVEWVVLDLRDGTRVDVRHRPTPIRPNNDPLVQWSGDGRSIFFMEEEAGYARGWIRAIDAGTGVVRTLHEETTDTVLDRYPLLRAFGDGSGLIWSSERDGWRHLYLIDARNGGIERQLTSGAWNVRAGTGIVHVDGEGGWVYFMAQGREAGRDPYFLHLYRVGLDGGAPELLTPEDADHKVEFSPDGSVFVDTHSRVDSPPVSVLRTSSGEQVAELQRADIRRLLAAGWRFPQRFTVKARDGETDLHGVLYLPSGFDPSGSYPVIDSIYPGPQSPRVPRAFAITAEQALAELGFVVIQIDGLGTPHRSRAFREFSYRNLGDAGGLDDHIAGLRQLQRERPWMDLERVGIFGHSGGGFASTRAILTHPEFYKVAVSSSGNHDQRIYHAGWGERYQGYPDGDNYAGLDNASLAHRLEGKLLLAHGDADDNVHPAHTLALAQALIEADKDFDLLILPNQNHRFEGQARHYFTRKRWDYFVRHLLDSEPPAGYRIGSDRNADTGRTAD